jgi:hypothetical protein
MTDLTRAVLFILALPLAFGAGVIGAWLIGWANNRRSSFARGNSQLGNETVDLFQLAKALTSQGWTCSLDQDALGGERAIEAAIGRQPERLWVSSHGLIQVSDRNHGNRVIGLTPELIEAVDTVRLFSPATRPALGLLPEAQGPGADRVARSPSKPGLSLPVETARKAERCCRAIATSWDDIEAEEAANVLREAVAALDGSAAVDRVIHITWANAMDGDDENSAFGGSWDLATTEQEASQ